jgi:hypothetical protein
MISSQTLRAILVKVAQDAGATREQAVVLARQADERHRQSGADSSEIIAEVQQLVRELPG